MADKRRFRLLRAAFILAAVSAVYGPGPALAGYSSTSLIDVPASEYLDHLQYEADFILAVSGKSYVSPYGVANFNLGVAGMSEVGLALYSVWEEPVLGAHFKVELIDEEHFSRYQPAVSLGMDNLTIGDGIISHVGNRLPRDTAAYDMDFRDNISPFVVTSKTISPFGTFHLGWGYGRFIGAGPRSSYFHGVFMGCNVRVWKTFEVMVEEDGRDVNVGVRHILPWITVGAAVEKAEQLWGDYEPFYTITVEFSPRPLHTGPERLAVRRAIRSCEERLGFLARRVDAEEEMIAAIRGRIYDLTDEYEGQGIFAGNIDQVRVEIEELERKLEAAEEERETERAPGEGAGI